MIARILTVAAMLGASPALAALEFCNPTDTVASVAIGYKADGGWTSEGWWNVDPGTCKVAVDGDLPLSHYYYRVEATGVDFDHARYMFCTSDDEFTIVGDEGCSGRGFDSEGFNEIALDGRTGVSVTLTPASAAAPEPAPEQAPKEEALTGGAALLNDIMEPSVTVDMPPSGTFGEPFTLTGTFSHCDVLDAGIQCMFVYEDWVYVASTYNHTPEAILADLYEREPNSRLLFSGDLASYEGAEAQIVLYTFTNAGSDDYAATRDALQGFWTSTEDPSSQILIYGSLFEEIYQDVPMDQTYMSFRDGCAGSPGDGPAFRLVSSDGMEERCMFASFPVPGELDLFMAGGMRPLTYRKTQ